MSSILKSQLESQSIAFFTSLQSKLSFGLVDFTRQSQIGKVSIALEASLEEFNACLAFDSSLLGSDVEQLNQFNATAPVIVSMLLRPDLISGFTSCNIYTLAELLNFNIDNPSHLLFDFSSWFILEIQQHSDLASHSYRTFWSYADPALLFSENPSTDELADRLVEFFQDWAKHNLPNLTQTAIAEAVQELSQELNTDADELSNLTQEAIATLFSEMVDSFQRWTQGESLDTLSPSQQQPLMPIVQGFFDQDGWDCKLENPSTLRLLAQGKTEKWTCYAQVVAQHQFLFYSICPIAIPKPKRNKLAEFITRANYGMTIGNFELDYTDGEIRYKTSIDVEGEKLTSALIKRLVYTNVAMMDEYLPGIRAMIEDGLSAEAAIQAAEVKILD